jgi:hypothetical protein
VAVAARVVIQRVEEMRERERERSGRKKGQGRLYSLMFVGPTHQLTNISGLAYVAAVAPYVRRPPDERNSKYQHQP